MYSTISTKLMITKKITSWEREITTSLLVQASAPMRDYSLLIMGNSKVDEDGSGGRSPSQKGAGTGTYEPRIRVSAGGRVLLCFWKKSSRGMIFRSRVIL